MAPTAPYCGKETGETALLRALWDELRPGDLLEAARNTMLQTTVGVHL